MDVLDRSFYERSVLRVAKDLLGKLLVREFGGGRAVGKIVEVEAYRGRDDPASHAFRGLTKRNRVMFGKPGTAYVYLAYGVNWCLNVVAEPEGRPAAVLIRALEPVDGIEIMMKNRRTENIRELTNGPGKLTQALLIDSSFNGWDLTLGKRLFIVKHDGGRMLKVCSSSRIGIRVGKDRPWRFFLKDNPFVSRRVRDSRC